VRWGAGADALARIDRAEVHVPGALARIDRAEVHVPGALASALLADARARAEHDADALGGAVAALEALGCFGYAAASAATAAVWYSAAGRKGFATRSGEHAHALAGTIGDEIADPAAIEAITLLTAREREVATMAALGRADKEIAAALGVSVRTVETHLHRAYTKLGVTSRYGLADVMSAYVIDH
jgi:DNA-binding NarL/FixJ family response regulator